MYIKNNRIIASLLLPFHYNLWALPLAEKAEHEQCETSVHLFSDNNYIVKYDFLSSLCEHKQTYKFLFSDDKFEGLFRLSFSSISDRPDLRGTLTDSFYTTRVHEFSLIPGVNKTYNFTPVRDYGKTFSINLYDKNLLLSTENSGFIKSDHHSASVVLISPAQSIKSTRWYSEYPLVLSSNAKDSADQTVSSVQLKLLTDAYELLNPDSILRLYQNSDDNLYIPDGGASTRNLSLALEIIKNMVPVSIHIIFNESTKNKIDTITPVFKSVATAVTPIETYSFIQTTENILRSTPADNQKETWTLVKSIFHSAENGKLSREQIYHLKVLIQIYIENLATHLITSSSRYSNDSVDQLEKYQEFELTQDTLLSTDTDSILQNAEKKTHRNRRSIDIKPLESEIKKSVDDIESELSYLKKEGYKSARVLRDEFKKLVDFYEKNIEPMLMPKANTPSTPGTGNIFLNHPEESLNPHTGQGVQQSGNNVTVSGKTEFPSTEQPTVITESVVPERSKTTHAAEPGTTVSQQKTFQPSILSSRLSKYPATLSSTTIQTDGMIKSEMTSSTASPTTAATEQPTVITESVVPERSKSTHAAEPDTTVSQQKTIQPSVLSNRLSEYSTTLSSTTIQTDGVIKSEMTSSTASPTTAAKSSTTPDISVSILALKKILKKNSKNTLLGRLKKELKSENIDVSERYKSSLLEYLNESLELYETTILVEALSAFAHAIKDTHPVASSYFDQQLSTLLKQLEAYQDSKSQKERKRLRRSIIKDLQDILENFIEFESSPIKYQELVEFISGFEEQRDNFIAEIYADSFNDPVIKKLFDKSTGSDQIASKISELNNQVKSFLNHNDFYNAGKITFITNAAIFQLASNIKKTKSTVPSENFEPFYKKSLKALLEDFNNLKDMPIASDAEKQISQILHFSFVYDTFIIYKGYNEIDPGFCFADALLSAVAADNENLLLAIDGLVNSVVNPDKYFDRMPLQIRQIFQFYYMSFKGNNVSDNEFLKHKLKSKSLYMNNYTAQIRSMREALNATAASFQSMSQLIDMLVKPLENLQPDETGKNQMMIRPKPNHVAYALSEKLGQQSFRIIITDIQTSTHIIYAKDLEELRTKAQDKLKSFRLHYKIKETLTSGSSSVPDKLYEYMDITSDAIDVIKGLTLLPGSALTIEDIVTHSVSELPNISKARTADFVKSYIQKVTSPENKARLKKASVSHEFSEPDQQVTTSDPVISQMREVLAALEQAGQDPDYTIPDDVLALSANVAKVFSDLHDSGLQDQAGTSSASKDKSGKTKNNTLKNIKSLSVSSTADTSEGISELLELGLKRDFLNILSPEYAVADAPHLPAAKKAGKKTDKSHTLEKSLEGASGVLGGAGGTLAFLKWLKSSSSQAADQSESTELNDVDFTEEEITQEEIDDAINEVLDISPEKMPDVPKEEPEEIDSHLRRPQQTEENQSREPVRCRRSTSDSCRNQDSEDNDSNTETNNNDDDVDVDVDADADLDVADSSELAVDGAVAGGEGEEAEGQGGATAGGIGVFAFLKRLFDHKDSSNDDENNNGNNNNDANDNKNEAISAPEQTVQQSTDATTSKPSTLLVHTRRAGTATLEVKTTTPTLWPIISRIRSTKAEPSSTIGQTGQTSSTPPPYAESTTFRAEPTSADPVSSTGQTSSPPSAAPTITFRAEPTSADPVSSTGQTSSPPSAVPTTFRTEPTSADPVSSTGQTSSAPSAAPTTFRTEPTSADPVSSTGQTSSAPSAAPTITFRAEPTSADLVSSNGQTSSTPSLLSTIFRTPTSQYRSNSSLTHNLPTQVENYTSSQKLLEQFKNNAQSILNEFESHAKEVSSATWLPTPKVHNHFDVLLQNKAFLQKVLRIHVVSLYKHLRRTRADIFKIKENDTGSVSNIESITKTVELLDREFFKNLDTIYNHFCKYRYELFNNANYIPEALRKTRFYQDSVKEYHQHAEERFFKLVKLFFNDDPKQGDLPMYLRHYASVASLQKKINHEAAKAKEDIIWSAKVSTLKMNLKQASVKLNKPNFDLQTSWGNRNRLAIEELIQRESYIFLEKIEFVRNVLTKEKIISIIR